MASGCPRWERLPPLFSAPDSARGPRFVIGVWPSILPQPNTDFCVGISDLARVLSGSAASCPVSLAILLLLDGRMQACWQGPPPALHSRDRAQLFPSFLLPFGHDRAPSLRSADRWWILASDATASQTWLNTHPFSSLLGTFVCRLHSFVHVAGTYFGFSPPNGLSPRCLGHFPSLAAGAAIVLSSIALHFFCLLMPPAGRHYRDEPICQCVSDGRTRPSHFILFLPPFDLKRAIRVHRLP